VTVHFYFESDTANEVKDLVVNGNTGEKYLINHFKSPRQVSSLTPELTTLTRRVSWRDQRWEGDGYSYQLGIYRGEGWEVEITKKYETRGSRPTRMRDVQFEIVGTFTTLALAQAFEEQLDYGSLRPTFPLGGNQFCKEIDVAQASLVVANSAAIRELQALVAQQAHHIRNLEQLLQGLLTPKNV